jgi:hypothetical protein
MALQCGQTSLIKTLAALNEIGDRINWLTRCLVRDFPVQQRLAVKAWFWVEAETWQFWAK